jgi:dihydroflavonol-4-reductase
MTALVTGATGFVGSAVARKLLNRGESVRVMARESSDKSNLDGLDVEIVTGDLTDKASLKAACLGCDRLYHVAADYRLWTLDPAEMLKANVEGSRDIILSAAEAGVTRMVYCSSVAVLGTDPEPPHGTEDTPVTYANMIGPYKQSKFLAEEAVREIIKNQNLYVVIVNPSTPIGPRDIKPTPTGRMIVEAASGRMPAYVDTGLNIAHVDDVAEGHLLAMDKGVTGERYILGGENMTLREILTDIAGIVGRKPPKVCIPHNAILPFAALAEGWARITRGEEPFATLDGIKMAKKKMFFSSDKAKRVLGYSPRPAHQALADAVDWFREKNYLR